MKKNNKSSCPLISQNCHLVVVPTYFTKLPFSRRAHLLHKIAKIKFLKIKKRKIKNIILLIFNYRLDDLDSKINREPRAFNSIEK